MKLSEFLPHATQIVSDAFQSKAVMLATTMTATTAIAFQAFFNKYIFSDWDFGKALLIIVVFDTLTGVWKSIKLHQFKSYTFGGFITKAILYSIFLAVIQTLTAVTGDTYVWVKPAAYTGIIAREAISCIENMGVIAPKLVPTWILKRLKDFDNEGKFTGQDKPETRIL